MTHTKSRLLSRTFATVVSALLLCYSFSTVSEVNAFLPPSQRQGGWGLVLPNQFPNQNLRNGVTLAVSGVNVQEKQKQENDDDDDFESDEQLLREVDKSQLEELCKQYGLEATGTKEELLLKLRTFAEEQAELEQQRKLDRKARVEAEDANEGKERYEVVDNYYEEDDDEEEGLFYFNLPTSPNATGSSTEENMKQEKKPKKPTILDSSVITAPPPPDVEPNENGERVVTVYSTTDQNDLTGVASAQPGQQFSDNALLSGEASQNGGSAPWDVSSAQQKNEATSKEVEEATEIVTELVHALLTMTGAPAFREEFSEGLTPFGEDLEIESMTSPGGFVGFDPSTVPADILTTSSRALRVNRGEVLQEVLRDYELRAIGHDGIHGDNKEKGGGHYQEVTKVRAFLEGYRRAEVRRIARETTTLLLDKIVSEGVEGLDLTLASMGRNGDDTSDAGDLNDSLLDYLNDAIRQQEKKVDQIVATEAKLAGVNVLPVEVDKTAKLWNVTNENGERIETLDPNDPAVKKILEDEISKSQQSGLVDETRSKTAPEQLLLLLCLLRDRIKAEAAFSNDEHGRNLRILAHCIHARSDKERETIIMKEMGSSLNRLESFEELLNSSIEYAESASHQLQPSKTSPLNTLLLKKIKSLVEDLGERQSWKASGVAGGK